MNLVSFFLDRFCQLLPGGFIILDNQNPDGSWSQPKVAGPGTNGPAIYHTALCTLMLEVYYRFLPGTGGK